MADKFEAFASEIKQMHAALDVPCDNDTVLSYWRQLHDCRISDIKARIDLFLADNEGKKVRPPRAWELKTAVEGATHGPNEIADPKMRPMIIRAIKRMDELYLRDPVEWAIEWNIQLCTRKVETIPDTDPAWPAWMEQLREWHRISRGQQPNGQMSPDPRLLKEMSVPTYATQATWSVERRKDQLAIMVRARLARGCPA